MMTYNFIPELSSKSIDPKTNFKSRSSSAKKDDFNSFKDIMSKKRQQSEFKDQSIGISKETVVSKKEKEPKQSYDHKISLEKSRKEAQVGERDPKEELAAQKLASEPSQELIAHLAEITGLAPSHIEKIFDVSQDVLGQQEILSDINMILQSLNKDINLGAGEKFAVIEKLQAFLNQMSVDMKENVENVPNADVMILGQLRQEILEVKRQIQGLTQAHTFIQQEINDVMQRTNMHTANQNIDASVSEETEQQQQGQNVTKIENSEDLKKQESDQKGNNGSSEEKGSLLTSKLQVVNQQTKNTAEHPDAVPFNEVIDAKTDIVGTVNKSFTASQPERANVFKQVVENAKVVIQDGKSEMTLQLKPENLGKLSLEVVTERGMLVAKFFAESQQVKEIIESNLPQLKDALESQGLNVQGFSVSVGDNRAHQEAFQKGRSSKAHKNLQTKVQNSGISTLEYESEHAVVNPYNISDSSIDFTA